MRIHILMLAFTVVLCACTPTSSVFLERGEVRIQYEAMRITDTVIIDASHMSMDGRWHIYGKQLFYIDNHQVYLKHFDTLGNFLERKLEHGRGPNELLSPPVFFGYTTENEIIYIDKNWFFYRFTEEGKEQYCHQFLKDVIFNASDWQDLFQRPNPENVMMYELEIQYRQFALFKDWIIIPIATEHINFNGFDKTAHAKEFYERAYNLGAFNRQTFFQEHFFGFYPSIYRKKMIPNFIASCVAADEHYLYVGYEADPLVYVYDDHLEPAFAFGFEGVDMKNNYPETSSVGDAFDKRKEQRQKYDHYGALQYITPYLFRSYTSGGIVRLQVYENTNLVADINTGSREFQMMGYIEPYYYACVACDIDNEEYRIIKFKIE